MTSLNYEEGKIYNEYLDGKENNGSDSSKPTLFSGNNMNVIPKEIEDWNFNTINELIKLKDIESENFDFKGTKTKELAKHLCAFANTKGGFLVLGIDEKVNGEIKIGFEKNGFNKGREDHVKNDIRNHQVQIEPIPDIQIKIIPEGEKFFTVIQIEYNKFKKPYMLKEKGSCFVRIGGSTTPASRSTIIELSGDVRNFVQDLENLKASLIILREDFILTIGKFRYISPAAPNRLAKLDLSLVRSNIVKCQSFLIEKNLLGRLTKVKIEEQITIILHTLDTLNSYIDGFSNSTNVEIKKSLQKQILDRHYTLYSELESVQPFLEYVIKVIDEQLYKIQGK